MLLRTAAVALVALAVGATAGARQLANEWTLKFDGPSSVTVDTDFNVAASVTYTYATNNDNIVLNVQLPDAATVVSYDDHTDCTNPTLTKVATCTFHMLSGTATVNFKLHAPLTAGTNLNYLATTANGFLSPTPPPGIQGGTTTIAPPPVITMTSAPTSSQVALGSQATFNISATNTGSTAMANVWVTGSLGLNWTGGSMTQTGGPALACSSPDAFDTNCFTASLPAGATVSFTETATPSPGAGVGTILNTRYMVYLGASPGGTSYATTAASIQVAAPSSTTTTTPVTSTTATTLPNNTVSRPSITTTTTTTTTAPTTTTATTTTPATTTPPPPKCHVPSVAGRMLATARTRAGLRHCRLVLAYAYSAKVEKGRVVSQTPLAGTILRTMGMVHVVISRGPRPKRR